jgi:hypothetical protein
MDTQVPLLVHFLYSNVTPPSIKFLHSFSFLHLVISLKLATYRVALASLLVLLHQLEWLQGLSQSYSNPTTQTSFSWLIFCFQSMGTICIWAVLSFWVVCEYWIVYGCLHFSFFFFFFFLPIFGNRLWCDESVHCFCCTTGRTNFFSGKKIINELLFMMFAFLCQHLIYRNHVTEYKLMFILFM